MSSQNWNKKLRAKRSQYDRPPTVPLKRGHGCPIVMRNTVCPSMEMPNALSRTWVGKISLATIAAIGPLDQQYVSPTMKSIATSTTAAAVLLLSGKAVVREEQTSKASAWIPKP